MRRFGNATLRYLGKPAVRAALASAGATLLYAAGSGERCSPFVPLCEEYSPTVDIRKCLILRQPYSDFAQDYEIIEKLGEGGFATIYKVRHRSTGSVRVAKVARLYSESDLRIFKNEVAVMAQVDSPYVGRIVSYYLDNDRSVNASRSVPTAVLVTHFVNGIDLLDAINDRISRRESFSTDEAWSLAYEMIRAVASVHQSGFVHRDIKPENFILVDLNGQKSLKLIDFGLASRSGVEEQVHESAGTTFYMAPEIAEATGTPKFTPVGDSWSIGVILATLASKGSALIGRATSLGTSGRKKVSSVSVTEEISKLAAKGASPEMVTLVASLLQHDPNQRLSAVDAVSKFRVLQDKTLSDIPSSEFDSILRDLRDFTRRPVLSQLVRRMAVHSTDDQALRRSEVIFRALDRDADGIITRHDLLSRSGDASEAEDVINLVFPDPTRPGLKYSDFLALGLDFESEQSRNVLRCIFEQLSASGDIIDLTSLKRFLHINGIKLSPGDLINSCHSVMSDQMKTELTYEEFVRCVHSLV